MSAQNPPSSLTHGAIVILTGAGISAESGLPTFRGSDGLWEGHHVEEVASPQGFEAMPEKVHRFYNMRRAALKNVQPNVAHEALVRLEKEWPGEVLLVTQNVDDLHERAGSQRLLHMHGELTKVRCTDCNAVVHWTEDLDQQTPCPTCGVAGGMRPHIVWFGEMPMFMDEIEQHLQSATTFISIGTSGVVYPAAGFVHLAASFGVPRLIEVNVACTSTSRKIHEHRIGPATVEVPKLVDDLLAAA